MEDQELLAKINSNVTLPGSFGANNDGSTYIESRENFPTIENTTPDLLTIIKETGNILKVFGEGLDELNAPRVIFTQKDELEPMELVEVEANQNKTPLDNGGMMLLLNQFPYQYSPPVDTSYAIDSLLSGA